MNLTSINKQIHEHIAILRYKIAMKISKKQWMKKVIMG